LTALGGYVGGDALTQYAFLERDPLHFGVGMGLLEELVSFCISII
jgi:hypothetical protein